MDSIDLNTQKPTYNYSLPYVDETLSRNYKTIFPLLDNLTANESIFYSFQKLKRLFIKESPLAPYKKLICTIYYIKQEYPDLPQAWRKEIRKIDAWISQHLLITKFEMLKKDVALLQKQELSCFRSPERGGIANFVYVENTYFVAEKEQAASIDTYTLTGKVKRVFLKDPPSPRLQQSLKLAHRIVQYVHSFIKYSPNYPVRNPLFSRIAAQALDDEGLKKLDKQIYTLFSKTEKIQLFGYGRYCNPHSEQLLEFSALGNCRGASLLGFLYARGQTRSNRVELASIKNGDHFFLIIDSSVFCDPWSGTYSPLTEMDHLLDYISFDSSAYRPIVRTVPLSQRESIYAKDPFFLLHFDQKQIELGNAAVVEEFLALNPMYTSDISVYNDFLQRALDNSHPKILSLLLQKGDPQKIYPHLQKELFCYAMYTCANKSIKPASHKEILSKINPIFLMYFLFSLIKKHLSLAKKNLA